ncbi:MAG: phosphodiester glycosidase family protein [Candidatus Omnitrophica bacterium]|nr:phosphodiester glycosidase family protein [Candidatus Omnitrophota bacterium]MCM8824946.1 phosphodiester glycosidase family protein [Candidatus Omnitrophota bacterium]
MKTLRTFISFCFFFVFLCLAEQFSHLSQYGIQYSFHQLNQPRPIRIHALKIDLQKGSVKPVVIPAKDPDGPGQAEAVLTNPLELAKDKNVIAFVNTNPWDSFPDEKGKRNRNWYDGQPVDITGLAATGGRLISPAGDGCVSVWTDSTGRFYISQKPDEKIMSEGVAGWYQIVKARQIIPKQNETLNPLTGIGIDQTGYIVWLVVADGRQKGFSEGMSHYELAEFMIGLGCYDVALMDGGGSSIMGISDEKGCIRIVNSPSDRILWIHRIRPLPLILAIKKSDS